MDFGHISVPWNAWRMTRQGASSHHLPKWCRHIHASEETRCPRYMIHMMQKDAKIWDSHHRTCPLNPWSLVDLLGFSYWENQCIPGISASSPKLFSATISGGSLDATIGWAWLPVSWGLSEGSRCSLEDFYGFLINPITLTLKTP